MFWMKLSLQKKIVEFSQEDIELIALSGKIKEFIEEDKDYVQSHSKLLFKAQEWEMNGRKEKDLLHGKECENAIKWLSSSSEVILPLEIHLDYINASKNLSGLMVVLLSLEEKMRFFTRIKWFDRVALFISLGNPVALAVQLKHLIPTSKIKQDFPIEMWFLFLLINVTLTLVGIKSKDLGLFVSMFLSVIVVLTVITLVLTHL